jgi:hypothetical protein
LKVEFSEVRRPKGIAAVDCGRHVSIDRELRIIEFAGRRSLRVEISEVRNPKTVRVVDLKRTRGRRSVIAGKVRFER